MTLRISEQSPDGLPMDATPASHVAIARILCDLAEIGRRLVQTSESALALLTEAEAECRSTPPGPAVGKTPNMDTLAPQLLTPDQVADLLQVGIRTLRRLRNDPRVKFPTPVENLRPSRWRRSEIEAWITGGR